MSSGASIQLKPRQSDLKAMNLSRARVLSFSLQEMKEDSGLVSLNVYPMFSHRDPQQNMQDGKY